VYFVQKVVELITVRFPGKYSQQKMIGMCWLAVCGNLRLACHNAQIDYLVYESTSPVLEGNQI
jgi:hypothetical protein